MGASVALTDRTRRVGALLLDLAAEILTRAGARFKRAIARADDAAYLSYNLVGRADWSSDTGHRTNEATFILRTRAGQRCSSERTQVFLVLLLLEQAEILLYQSHLGLECLQCFMGRAGGAVRHRADR